MNISAVIVTRGDVDLTPILDSLPREWERVIWNNGNSQHGYCQIQTPGKPLAGFVYDQPDLKVFGRYAALTYASHDLMYVQDDDVILENPQELVDAWAEMRALNEIEQADDPWDFAVCNMPERFRHDFYRDHALVGFGAVFPRETANRAFDLWAEAGPSYPDYGWKGDVFLRTCDIVFTGLSHRVLVDSPIEILDYAHGANRMWKQRQHLLERTEMATLMRVVEARRRLERGAA